MDVERPDPDSSAPGGGVMAEDAVAEDAVAEDNAPAPKPPISRRQGGRLLVVLFSLLLGMCGLSRQWSPRQPENTSPYQRLGFRVDPNRASVAELSLLPGVGPTLAARIVEHRRREGPFRTRGDVMEVRGIGPGKLAQMASYLALPDDKLTLRDGQRAGADGISGRPETTFDDI